MQWLINLIIERIGIPPTFIDRGDPATPDFDHTDFTNDEVWRELDLSGIVPSNASAVLINFMFTTTAINNAAMFRTKGNNDVYNVSMNLSQVAGIRNGNDNVIPIGSDGKIEYNLCAACVWLIANLTVKGWWL